MSYLVFARKYRPQNFDEIVGQEHITTTLKNAILQNRIAHAYLFAGPRGIGKTSTARIFSKALNCEKGPTTTPCNKCDTCKEISSGTSLDVLEIDGASNRGIEEIRNLRENVKFFPSKGKFKIYIIDEVHMLTTEAFNALLKTLEEPPPHVKFIFATTQPHKILPTILSRCQRFNFKRVSATDLVQVLKGIANKEKIEAEEDALYAIAYASEGGLRDAESILDQLSSFSHGKVTSEDVHSVLGMVGQEVYFDIAQKIIDKDIAGCLNLIDELEKNGKDLSQFILGLINHFRNLMVAKFGKDVAYLLEMSGESINKLVHISKSVSQEDLLYISNVLINTQDIIRRTNSPRIPLEMSLVRLSMRANMASIDEALNKLSGIESRLSNPSQAIAGQECPAYSVVREEPRSNYIAKNEVRKPAASSHNTAGNSKISKGLTGDDEKTLEYIKGIWTDVLSKVREKKMSTATYLAEGEPVSIKSNQLTIGIPAQFILHKEVLEDTGNRQLIEAVLNDLSGGNIKVNFVITNTQTRSEDKGVGVTNTGKLEEVLTAEPIVKKVLELFEGKVTKIVQ
jgi:DNA polymerase-3 subunit gamma/tau